jgi:hypothetical protein
MCHLQKIHNLSSQRGECVWYGPVLPPPPAQFFCTDEVGVAVILQAYSGWVPGSILGLSF